MMLCVMSGFCLSCDPDCIDGSGPVKSESRNVGSFNGVKLGISAELRVDQTSAQECSIQAQSNVLSVIETRIVDGTLNINSNTCFGSTEPIIIIIKNPEITKFIVNGSGSIKSTGKITGDHLEFGVNGSGSIIADVDGNQIYGGLKGSGEIALKGTAKEQFVKLSGSGKYNAPELATVKSDVNLDGSGELSVFAIEKLNANLSGSGNIYYKGSPRTSMNVQGSGSVEKLK